MNPKSSQPLDPDAPEEQAAPPNSTTDDPTVTAIQILIPCAAFPGLTAGAIIQQPTPEQISAARENAGSVHLIER